MVYKSTFIPWRMIAGLFLALILVGAQPGIRVGAETPPVNSPLACPRYQTTIGGTGTDYAWDNATDSAGNVYVTGMTDSADFPVTAGAYDTSYNGNADAYVMKLNPQGQIVYATYLGGTMLDQGSKIAVDSQGNAYVAGYTYSTDFPTTANAYDRSFNGGTIDAFVTKLDPNGQLLSYSTFLGGREDDYGGGIAVGGNGAAYVTGYTESSDYPTTPLAYDTSYNGGGDIIATALAPDGGSLLYSTFVGGSAFDGGYGIGIDPRGNLLISGQTSSMDFPVTAGAFSQQYGGGAGDAFVIKIAPNGQSLRYATYLGGEDFEDARALAIGPRGTAVIGGRTSSVAFPVTSQAYDQTYNGGRDVFISQLSSDGSTLIYSTFIGGSGEEETGDITLDSAGNIALMGWTQSTDFPLTANACQTFNGGDYDMFYLNLKASGDRLIYSTYMGGIYADYGRGLSIGFNGRVVVSGYSTEPPMDVSVFQFKH